MWGNGAWFNQYVFEAFRIFNRMIPRRGLTSILFHFHELNEDVAGFDVHRYFPHGDNQRLKGCRNRRPT
jgi:hypothetical protein